MSELDASATESQELGSNKREDGRYCWVCFATDDDDALALWVQPCKCKGTTKWVHQVCLQRWVDEKQKGNSLKCVVCPQCQTEYIIVFPNMGPMVNFLEIVDTLIKRLSPFLAAGVVVGSLYWTAVTYGAITILQVVGHKEGLSVMENSDPLVLLIGLPAIPVGLVLGKMIRWEDAILRFLQNRRTVARKFPLLNLVLPISDSEENVPSESSSAAPILSDPVSATRILCGAILLPTVSSIVGRIFFESIQNNLHRTIIGGLAFITVKGALKIYHKQQQFVRKKQRKILDYCDENVSAYVSKNPRSTRSTQASQL
ncbi:E3 ubiquitin-protein ligase MARCHF5 [Phlebotomus argentipes]|uniref:E3 ubiquitin-protein ligase MARCHF5 n=1 Tax=Phlebotomus argentipes TaxID=94469 RepID=UPI0028937FFD|nr:E3 ubiquitin-protein ligase MARCHF5 [Phlebotomus argentipes]